MKIYIAYFNPEILPGLPCVYSLEEHEFKSITLSTGWHVVNKLEATITAALYNPGGVVIDYSERPGRLNYNHETIL